MLLCAGALASLLPVAQAADVGQHPAVFAPRSIASIDANTFIVGHPASPTTRAVHANFAHPALRQQSMALDTNHFLVQPPASVQWISAADVTTQQQVASIR
jgi:hypothetical protein